MCKIKFFHISKLSHITNSNYDNYFEPSEVQIQMGGGNVKNMVNYQIFLIFKMIIASKVVRDANLGQKSLTFIFKSLLVA